MLPGIALRPTYCVVGSVMLEGGAPGRKASTWARSTTSAVSTSRIEIAWFGHACTHAGGSPASRRPLHMSHLRTMPRFLLNCGTS
jgi:hypothetical protein